jgi:hypothetical protein
VDDSAQKLMQELAMVGTNAQGYSLSEGLIIYRKKIWVGANSALQTNLIHASAMGGHSGSKATFQRLSKVFWWSGMKQDVEAYIKQFQTCQQAKHENCRSPGLLYPLPIPVNAWQDILMGFIEALPKC